jgi:hypothetical protein
MSMRQLAGRLNFSLKTALPVTLAFRVRDGQQFDGHIPPEARIVCPIYQAVGAFANQLYDLITAYLLWRHDGRPEAQFNSGTRRQLVALTQHYGEFSA